MHIPPIDGSSSRLLSAALSCVLIAATGGAIAAEQRVQYCSPGRCTQSGRGYTMCERLRRALDEVPQTEVLPSCRADIPRSGFHEPIWKPLHIKDNYHIIYDIEMFLVNPAKGDHYYSKWPDRFPDPYWISRDFNSPETWRRIPYDEWVQDFESRVAGGLIAPHLASTSVSLIQGRPQTIYKYDNVPDGALARCEKGVHDYGYGNGGYRMFVAGDNPQEPVLSIPGVSHLPLQLNVYEGRGVFVLLEGPSTWGLRVLVAYPGPSNSPSGVYAQERCGLEEHSHRSP